MRLATGLSLAIGLSCLPLVASNAAGADLVRLSPEAGLGRAQLRHLEINDAGDYVAVSHQRVFLGNYRDGTFDQVLEAADGNFVLEASAALPGSSGSTVRADVEVLGTRLALNGRGDFVLASNSRLYAGNARLKSVVEVARAGTWSRFQQVAINDAGHVVAITDDEIFAGTIGGTVSEVVSDAVGSLEIISLYGYSDFFTVETGSRRLALNASGQFVAVTGSAIYGGSAPAATAAKLHEERGAGFTHVSLADDGVFVTVTERAVYRGAL